MGIRLFRKLSLKAALTLLTVRTPHQAILPWARYLQDRSPRSESICPVERPYSCDTGHYARLATKGSVQQSPPSTDQCTLNMPGHTRSRYPVLGPGTRCSVPPTTPGKQGTVTTPGTLIIPGSPCSTVTPGESVRPVHTGQKAQLEKADQCLAQSELPVFNYTPGIRSI